MIVKMIHLNLYKYLQHSTQIVKLSNDKIEFFKSKQSRKINNYHILSVAYGKKFAT